MRIHTDKRGFTLIEVLVVVVIVGVLAAIALPLFLAQPQKAQDADAKDNARNLLSQVEACFSREQDYRSCDSAQGLGSTGLSLGTASGDVTVSARAQRVYTISSYSTTGVTYEITRDAGAGADYTCTPTKRGDCPASGEW